MTTDTVMKEIDEALFVALRNSVGPIDRTWAILLNTEARNDFMRACVERAYQTPERAYQTPAKHERYRGAVLAVTHDDEQPRVSILKRVSDPREQDNDN